MMNLLRPEISTLAEYRLTQVPHRIKLNQNENPYELPLEIKEEVLRRLAAARWSRYPAFVPQEQIARVASFARWRSDGTLLGNGSNELLQLIFTCVLERGKSVIISQPTFTLYKILARSLGATVVDVPMTLTFEFDVTMIVSAARASGADLVVLCSPNNPTGSCLTREQIVRILEGTKGLVVLDEAYVQFAGETQVELLRKYDRLIILQTFSKAMAAAGLRFGYALGPPDLMKQLDKVKLPYNVNIFTLTAVETFIERWHDIKWWIGRIVAERERVRGELERIEQLRVYPSGANFLLFESLKRSPAEVFASLAGKGILIRDVSSYPMLSRGLRVTIGTPDENDEFLKAIREAV
jgi:histidinol-phosphate aminotransferase